MHGRSRRHVPYHELQRPYGSASKYVAPPRAIPGTAPSSKCYRFRWKRFASISEENQERECGGWTARPSPDGIHIKGQRQVHLKTTQVLAVQTWAQPDFTISGRVRVHRSDFALVIFGLPRLKLTQREGQNDASER